MIRQMIPQYNHPAEIQAALQRKQYMRELPDADIPVFEAMGRRITEESAEQASSIYDAPSAG